MFESLSHLSIMKELQLRKRAAEAAADSIDVQETKRFHHEEADRFLHVLQFDRTLADADDEEEFAASEELLNGVMRSLEKEIAARCSSSNPSSIIGDNSAGPDITKGHEGQALHSDSGLNLSYLMQASDEELGIPPSPVLDFKKEIYQSSKDISETLVDSTPKSIAENWHLENDFENYQLSTLYGNSRDGIQLDDYENRDFTSQTMSFEGDIPRAWRLDISGGM